MLITQAGLEVVLNYFEESERKKKTTHKIIQFFKILLDPRLEFLNKKKEDSLRKKGIDSTNVG